MAVLPWILTLTVNAYIALATPFEPVQSWSVISSAAVAVNATSLSLPGVNTSSWFQLNATKSTLMATLVGQGVYTENELFYSTNLQKVGKDQFQVPWYYRAEVALETPHDQDSWHILRTNGISSRADIYLNGHLVADKETQAGAYAGLKFDVTDKLCSNEKNVLLIKVYPTDYNRDFALGFVDWNPYPPDNGTGIWRDVEFKKSGQVGLSVPRVQTTLDGSVAVYVDAKNLAKNMSASGVLRCSIDGPDGRKIHEPESQFILKPGAQAKVKVHAKIAHPQIWWPKQWGDQPLYSVQCSATLNGTNHSSDTTATKFGIRTVTSTLNAKYNDTTFFVNKHPFQVLGAGYTSDMFLRFDERKLLTQFQYVLDMGLNTVRLEGKQEHPRLYELADQMGIMLLSGWECCDKWEGWTYNNEANGEKWVDADYGIAELAMRHEAEMMQAHPSMLGFLVGSDYWPDDRATKMYVDALKAFDWDTPIIASASQRGSPDLIGNGGMKMAGPYDWVPPNYWYDPEQRLGAAGGFGSELGAGVGTPEHSSLVKFLAPQDLEDLWKKKSAGLYHMSTNVSSFYTREIYNDGLYSRFGAPTSLGDYIIKAQMMDYEATKAQFEAYLTRWSTEFERPATGAIYWMLNNAWPSLHWNLFDYYLKPAGSYFGLKSAMAKQHVIYDYASRAVYVADRRLASEDGNSSARVVEIQAINLAGQTLLQHSIDTTTRPNSAVKATTLSPLANITQVHLLRLHLKSPTTNTTLSTNTYILAPTLDLLNWDNSTWYHTPVTSYSNLTSLATMPPSPLHISFTGSQVVLRNPSPVPAVFVRLHLIDAAGRDVLPVFWSDNYLTLWPGEERVVHVRYDGVEVVEEGVRVEVDARNVGKQIVEIHGFE